MDFLLVVIVIDLDHDLIDLLYTFLLFSYWKHLLHFIFSKMLRSPKYPAGTLWLWTV